MVPGTSGVPFAARRAFCAVRAWLKHVAFARQNKIGADRDLEIGQAGLQQIDRAPGVDCPDRALILQVADELPAFPIPKRFAPARNHRAVEIDAEKFDFHLDLTMIRLRVRARAGARVSDEIGLRTGNRAGGTKTSAPHTERAPQQTAR